MTEPPSLRRKVVVGAWVALGALGLLLTVLTRATSLGPLDALMVTFLLVGMPGLALVQAPLLARTEIERLPAYWSSIGTLAVLAALAGFVGTREGGLAAIGAVAIPAAPLLAWTLGLTGAGLGIIVAFRSVARAARLPDSQVVHALMPRTREEKAVFVLLSLAAGVGEEVAYRGYAIPVLIPLVGAAGAVALTSAIFGVLHVYQGPLGILRTAAMGAVLAWGFLASGSLLPPVLAHVLIDILAGIVLADRLLVPPEAVGVSPSTAPPAPADPA